MPKPAKSIKLYKNGDHHFLGRKFVINPKQISKLDNFYEYATDSLKPSFGAIRNIYTPVNGTRIDDLGKLQTGNSYVVGGSEQFRKIQGSSYPEIGTKKRPHIKKTYSHIKPGHHNVMYASSSSRWRTVADEINRPKQIYLLVNGDTQTAPMKMLLPSKLLKQSWERILEYITERVGIKLNRAVRRLHTINGDPIYTEKEVENGGTYVACGSDRFKKMHYRTGGMSYSAPVLKRKPLPPISRKPRKENLSQDLRIKAVMVKARPEIDELNRIDRSQQSSMQSTQSEKPVVPPITPKQEIFQGKPVRVAKPVPVQQTAEEVKFKPNAKVKPKYLDGLVKSVEEDKQLNNEVPIEKHLEVEISREVDRKLSLAEQEGPVVIQQTSPTNSKTEDETDEKLSVKSEMEDVQTNILEIKNDLENFSPRTVDSHITEVTNEDAENNGHITNRASVENELEDIEEDQDDQESVVEKMSVQRTITPAKTQQDEDSKIYEVASPRSFTKEEDNFRVSTEDTEEDRNIQNTRDSQRTDAKIESLPRDSYTNEQDNLTVETLPKSPRSNLVSEGLDQEESRTRDGRFDDPNAPFSEDVQDLEFSDAENDDNNLNEPKTEELPLSPVSKKAEELSNDALSDAIRNLSSDKLNELGDN